MDKKANEIFIPISTKVTNNVVLRSMREALTSLTPLIMVISIFMLIGNFPIPGWSDFWKSIFGESLVNQLSSIFVSVFNFIGLLVCIVISNAYSKNRKMNGITPVLIAMISFLLLVPMGTTVGDKVSSVYFGPNGIFFGIVVGISSVELYHLTLKKNWHIRMNESIPPAVSDSLTEMIPFGIVVIFFSMIKVVMSMTAVGSFYNLIILCIGRPMKYLGDTMIGTVLYNLIASLLWCFGINGPTVTNSFWSPVLFSLTQDNLIAFQSGGALPHIYTQQFIDIFTTYGGGGSTLSLLLIVVLVCKSSRLKELGKLALVPGIFGINEPVIFGLPVIFNPTILIPFVLVPVINTIISGFVFNMRWIPYTTGVMLPWTTPPILSGWLSTGSILAAVLQLFEIVLGMIVYYPFIKKLDNKYIIEERN